MKREGREAWGGGGQRTRSQHARKLLHGEGSLKQLRLVRGRMEVGGHKLPIQRERSNTLSSTELLRSTPSRTHAVQTPPLVPNQFTSKCSNLPL